MLNRIAQGAEGGVGKLAITDGAAVRSPSHKRVWLIAGRMSAPGVDGEIGVWASNSITGNGLIVAVDGFAQEFTVWPGADKADAEISQADAGVDEARQCVQ